MYINMSSVQLFQPPLTEVIRQVQAPLPPPPSIAPQRPRVYSSLPGFPDVCLY